MGSGEVLEGKPQLLETFTLKTCLKGEIRA